MKLINKDDLMSELERELDFTDDWKTAHEIVNVVKYFPTVEINVDGWIPCSERLPEVDWTGNGKQFSKTVLTTVLNRGNGDDDVFDEVFVDTAYMADGVWQMDCPPDINSDIPKWYEVIAWMPLPEPYKNKRIN